jgi:hypothetical protein
MGRGPESAVPQCRQSRILSPIWAISLRRTSMTKLLAIALALFAAPALAQETPQVPPDLLAYVGKTCSGTLGPTRNVDTFILRNGRLFVRHCFIGGGTQTACDPDMQDRGEYLVESEKDGTSWRGRMRSAAGAEHRFSPSEEGPDKVKVQVQFMRGDALQGTYACTPALN